MVELNGVLVTHALITTRELCIRCAQHYSWLAYYLLCLFCFLLCFTTYEAIFKHIQCLYRYVMRAVYIAKGSPLLPPDFVSIFDDLASSSLDVFFDPSRGLTSLPGLTLGTLSQLFSHSLILLFFVRYVILGKFPLSQILNLSLSNISKFQVK